MDSVNYIGQNLQFLRKNKKLKQAEMPDIIGVSTTTWSDYENSKTEPNLTTLLKISEFFEVDIDSLLRDDLRANVGSGNLIPKLPTSESPKKSNLISNPYSNLNQNLSENFGSHPGWVPRVVTVDTAGNENVVLVPVKARAGYLSGYADAEYVEQLPAYRLPGLNNGTFRMFEISGHSMHPTFEDKDIIIAKFVETPADIRDDRVYVVVSTESGVVVKRVLNRIKADNKLILRSDNYKHRDQYPNLVINAEDVLEIWYGIAVITRHMPGPSDQYTRLIDLEGRMALLEQQLSPKPRKNRTQMEDD